MRLETSGIVFDNGIPYAGARLKRLTPSRNARKAVENLVCDSCVDTLEVTEKRGINRIDHSKGRAIEERPHAYF